MSKLEELKAAYEAATPGQVVVSHGNCVYSKRTGARVYVCTKSEDPFVNASEAKQNASNAAFIALAHNMMPQLLEAARELANFVEYLVVAADDDSYAEEIDRATEILRRLT